MLFGGNSSGSIANDTWVYRTATPASFTGIGQGCPGSHGTPELDHQPCSPPWLGDVFGTQVSLALASAPVVFASSLVAAAPIRLGPFWMPACALFVDLVTTELRVASPGGVAMWSTRVPSVPALAGVELAQQALVLDAVNTAGAVMSNANALRVGIR